jgi:hypothetical protein
MRSETSNGAAKARLSTVKQSLAVASCSEAACDAAEARTRESSFREGLVWRTAAVLGEGLVPQTVVMLSDGIAMHGAAKHSNGMVQYCSVKLGEGKATQCAVRRSQATAETGGAQLRHAQQWHGGARQDNAPKRAAMAELAEEMRCGTPRGRGDTERSEAKRRRSGVEHKCAGQCGMGPGGFLNVGDHPVSFFFEEVSHVGKLFQSTDRESVKGLQ